MAVVKFKDINEANDFQKKLNNNKISFCRESPPMFGVKEHIFYTEGYDRSLEERLEAEARKLDYGLISVKPANL